MAREFFVNWDGIVPGQAWLTEDDAKAGAGSVKQCYHVIEKSAYDEMVKEVAKRNQYKINQEYLDNIHKTYEGIEAKLDIAVNFIEDAKMFSQCVATREIAKQTLGKINATQKDK